MEKREFKPFGEVSSLTLGGGGLGQGWGNTTREETVETVKFALECGITHFDVAPMYGKGEAERVVGESLQGRSVEGLFFTTKCRLGRLPDENVYDHLNNSLTRSLETMKIQKVDLFLLHSQLVEDDFTLFSNNEFKDRNSTTLSSYFNAAIPAFELLKKEGKIGSWGIGGMGQNNALIAAINHETPPEAMQCVINPLNSAGGIGYADEAYDPKLIFQAASDKQIPVLAIRAVQAGALTSKMDRKPHESGFDKLDFEDFIKAKPFREIADEWNISPAKLAHKYALSIQGPSSVILGVKNREELAECVKAEEEERLTPIEIKTLEDLF
jgi:aryl-alcohol dehydrogenase-like predicted oxidoreductase